MKTSNTKAMLGNALKVIIYGPAGSGKTSLAGTLSESTLIISAEAGLLSLNGKSIDVIDMTLDDSGNVLPKEKRISRLADIYKYTLTDECQAKYKNLFIDSLTEISQNLVEQLQLEFPERKDSLVLYGENAKRMRSLVKSFRDLPYYNVFFTALSEIDKDENNQRFIGISVIGKMSSALPAFFDEVFYLDVEKNEATGESVRRLVTEKSDKLMAKDRSGKLNKYEPANLAVIAAKIRGE